MKIIHSASKSILPVLFAALFGIAIAASPSFAMANDKLENSEGMEAGKEIKQQAQELNAATPNNEACQDKKEEKGKKDKKDKKDKKEKKDKHASDDAKKHARELAVKHNMTNRTALPEAERATLKRGSVLDSKIPHESVSEPLKSELQNNPEYKWEPEDEWFIVGQDLVLVHKESNKIHTIMRGVFR